MSRQKINPVRGMHDILPDMMARHKRVTDTACEVARLYGFDHVATPIVEFSEVFKRSLGDSSDVVNKEMYLFHDRKEKELVLRPENTAAIVRAFISNGLQNQLPARFFYEGPMFRYERPQKGRQRQFHQIGIEMLGAGANPMADVDIITCGYQVLKSLGLEKNIRLKINTLGDSADRDNYREKLVTYLNKYKSDLSQDSQMRLEKNPLRILDSKEKQDRDILQHAPLLQDSLSEKTVNYFQQVTDILKTIGIECDYDNKLVRGLDYYCHTVFEFITDDLGAQGTVLAGGRYDGLVAALGGGDIDGIGWAAGVERLALMLEETPPPTADVALLAIGEHAENRIITLANFLRSENIAVDYSYKNNIKKRMQNINECKIPFAIIIGDEELQNTACKIKNMQTGEEVILNSATGFSGEKIISDEKLATAVAVALQKFYRR